MKKIIFACSIVFSLATATKAQTSYTGAIGLGVDAFDEATFFGAKGKYFFSEKHVGQADVGFEDNATIITLLYSFHKEFVGARGLRWYLGAGPSIVLVQDFDNIFALRPHLGLDFKPNGVPFVVNFDWRPALVLSETGDGDPASFGLGLLFTIN
ncbi:hypothetical protein [Flagellimonas flava]|uniref:Outer membrane protein beta-barrel domain-containing protein n=1 Tax=Flagellimonas flava TaxID=570519 RepID=A0A1M5P339_9FLAO|nr:hypothetical protein [Allomuricauda flava]SHG96236.1 hypothetical protein SAMN04488116_3045 [Allomuricauda flava]